MSVSPVKLFEVVANIARVIMVAAPVAERVSQGVQTAVGPAKKAGVMEAIDAELGAASLAVGRDLRTDANVHAKVSALVDAYIALHNALDDRRAAGG